MNVSNLKHYEMRGRAVKVGGGLQFFLDVTGCKVISGTGGRGEERKDACGTALWIQEGRCVF